MLSRRTVQYENGIYNVEIVAKEASLADGIKFQATLRKQNEKHKPNDPADPEDWAAIYFYTQVYAMCMCGTAEIRNVEPNSQELILDGLTEDKFMELPEALVVYWQAAVAELNPQWLPFVGVNQKTEESQEATPTG
jgi:hypothetical protein